MAKQLSRNERVGTLRGTVGAFGEALNYPSSSFPPELSGKVSYQYSPSVINTFPEPHSIIDNIGYLVIIIDNIETKCTQNQCLIWDPPSVLEVDLLKFTRC